MNAKKILWTSIVLNILQVIFVVVMIVLVDKARSNYAMPMIGGIILVSVANVLVTAISYIYLQKKQYKHLLTSMKELEELNLTLRAQRHDYLNQIQVVYGLLDMDEYEDAKTYMHSVFKEITKVSRALKTAQPAINALLQAKLQVAERQGIDLYLDVRTDLKALQIEPWELCKALANIIDNAMTALKDQEEDKEVHIHIEQTEKAYIFKISNNGPQIPLNQRKVIFNQGYTTKKESGHGMGLYIVKSIINEANGTLELESDEIQTCFTIYLPR